MKSAYQRGREAALHELEQFLVDSAEMARKLATQDDTDRLPSERLGRFERGVFAGAYQANMALLAVVQTGQIPRLENILPAERAHG